MWIIIINSSDCEYGVGTRHSIKKKINSIRVSIREKESTGDYPIAEISEIEKYRKQLNDLKI